MPYHCQQHDIGSTFVRNVKLNKAALQTCICSCLANFDISGFFFENGNLKRNFHSAITSDDFFSFEFKLI